MSRVAANVGKLAAAVVLALVPAANAAGCANKAVTAATQSRTLVVYMEEQGGIVLRHTSLIISARGQAAMRFERCMTRFRLDGTLWRKLKAALKQTNMHALAGDYGPVARRAEESTWVIVAGHDTVRITAFSILPELKAKLEPLLGVLDEVISVGKLGLPRPCVSKRTIKSMMQGSRDIP